MKELSPHQIQKIKDSFREQTLEQNYGTILLETEKLVVRGRTNGFDYVEIFVHQKVKGVEQERERYRRGQTVMRTHGGLTSHHKVR